MLFGTRARGMLIFRVHDRERGLWSHDHDGIRPAHIRLRTCRDAALDASGCRVPSCAGECRHAGGRAPVPKPSAAGSYSVRREETDRRKRNGRHSMMVRFMRLVGRLVVGHPGLVTALSLVVTLLLYANIHNLRTGTDLTDLFGNRDPQWRAASQIGKELGYGNQLFVLIEAPDGGNGQHRQDGGNGRPSYRRHAEQRTVPACALRPAGGRTAQHGAVLYLEFSVIRPARANRGTEAAAGSATDSSNRSPRRH